MVKAYATIHFPAVVASRIRQAIASKRSHAVTVDEFLRQWASQVLLGLTAPYALQSDPRLSVFVQTRTRKPGGKSAPVAARNRKGGTEDVNVPKPLVEDIERAIDLHQTTIPNRTQFIVAAAEYGLEIVNLPRNRGLEAVLLPPHVDLPPGHRYFGGTR